MSKAGGKRKGPLLAGDSGAAQLAGERKAKPWQGPVFPGLLEEMNLDEVRAFAANLVVLPLGSTEPHGPHLPYGTDTCQVTALCRLAVGRANLGGARALLYPTLPITNNANFRKFPFALRIGVRTLMSVLLDIVTQCGEDGVEKVVIVNGHGGNPGAIQAVLREIAGMDGLPFVCATLLPADGSLPAKDFRSPIEHARPLEHAGEYETSLMMQLRPELVREDKLAEFPEGRLQCPALAKAFFVRPWHLYLPESAGGETRKASAAKGRTILNAEAQGLAELLLELSQAKVTKHFPYEK